MSGLEQKFIGLLPKKPYCADVLCDGLQILPRDIAARRRYIQPNGPTHLRWMVLDVDNATVDVPWIDSAVAQPHITIARQDNQSSYHYLYLVDPSVRSSATARAHPQAYWSAVESALVARLGADPLYTGLVCKNPLHSDWAVMWHDWNASPYTLGELSKGLDLDGWCERIKAVQMESSGRNCAVFDAARSWAYAAIRPYRQLHASLQAYHDWAKTVSNQVSVINRSLPFPLSQNEAQGIARSISRWTWQRMTGAKYDAWQRATQRAGGLAYAAKYSMKALGSTGGTVTAQRHDMSSLGSSGGSVTAQRHNMSATGKLRLDETSERQRKPWERLGISRRAYYYRKAAGKIL